MSKTNGSESNPNSESELENNENKYKKDINTYFKLPIFYNSKKKPVPANIIADLELIKPIQKSETAIYNHVFSPTHCFGNIILDSFSDFYTTDSHFLKDTQKMLKIFKKNEKKEEEEENKFDFQHMLTIWHEIKGETGFCEKYLYIEWEFGKFLNTNPHFLQAMSIYNIASPILSLFMPIFILIIPFFIIKLKGLQLTMNEYLDILKHIISNHAIGKIFTSFQEVDTTQKMYLILSAAFYIFSIYQNILTCIKFYSNTKKIHDYLLSFKKYIDFSIYKINSYLDITQNLSSYKLFNEDLSKHKYILLDIKTKLELISVFQISCSKVLEIGHILQCFYEIYDNKMYHESLLYSFGFHGYLDNITGLSAHLNKSIHFTKFIKKTNGIKPNKFTQAYYPNLINQPHVKNNTQLEPNIIITGPNASGKTTILKTTLINTILSQQFGCGCFESADLKPFDFLHCYLNIPDTSSRDSLFQAEARRCKEIIDHIHKYPNKTHFCVFDELYSGTNPEEATSSATAFMEYLAKYDNVSCILTTHYIQMCKTLETHKRIKNFHMQTIKEEDSFKYTYILQEGISEIKGGFKVLADMNYPLEILYSTTS